VTPGVPEFNGGRVDATLWARAVVKAQRDLGKQPPSAADLDTAIVDIQIDDTIHGASTITLQLEDPTLKLVTTGFLDADDDGRLDAIDVHYPADSDLWWRLTSVDLDIVGDATLSMTFMERRAMHLMAHKGPLKASRGKKTRAEFLKMLADRVEVDGGITFHSRELHVVQPVGKVPETKTEKQKKKDKDGGIADGEKIKVAGATATAEQRRHIEIAMGVAADEKAGHLATKAMICAGIGESNFRPVMNGAGSDYGGVFQGNVKDGTWDKNDTAGMAKAFLRGGKGFQAGGAIKLAADSMNAGKIAYMVEGSRSNFGSDSEAEHHYGQWGDEAEAIIKAYGGASLGGGTETYRKAYNFEVGTTEDPHEDFWAAMNRLADEVEWPLFLDGDDLYFDPETELIKQKPVLLLTPNHPALVSCKGTWDQRQIATELTLELVCDPFEFRAGEVIKLDGFGPFSSGSTAKLPGRWLVSETSRSRFEFTTTFTLKQPAKPKAEPAPETATRKTDDDGVASGSRRERIVQIAKDSLSTKTGQNYYLAGGTESHDITESRPGYRSDCSQWVREVYRKAGCPSPGNTSGEQLANGKRTSKPKPGDLLAGPAHVELYVGGDPSKNTIGHGSKAIDYSNSAYHLAHGLVYVTFDFLDD
jgi:hypothetical protein